jgi:ribose-phosphate pyrophosphokinase
MEKQRIRVYACNANHDLAERYAQCMHGEVGRVVLDHFADGEQRVVVGDDIATTSCIVVGTICDSDSLLRAGLLADALQRGGAQQIIGCFLLFPYARQNRGAPGEPISAKVIARWLETAGYTMVFSLDIHAPSIAGFFTTAALKNVVPAPAFAGALRGRGLGDRTQTIVLSTDHGAGARAAALASALGCSTSGFVKSRLAGKVVLQSYPRKEDVEGKMCILVDDIAATGETLRLCATWLHLAGALAVHVCVTHVVLPGLAEWLAANQTGALLLTCNYVPAIPNTAHVVIVDPVPIMAEAIAARLGQTGS